MVNRRFEYSRSALPVRRGLVTVFVVSTLLGACVDEPPPRSFMEFMEDTIAREGTLVRCNADREATANEPECVNARRAAAAIAAQAEAEERGRLQAQSEARLLAARRRYEAQQEEQRRAREAEQAEEELAYEALWAESPKPAEPPGADAAADESADPEPSLEPIVLPSSVHPPLTTISLPRDAKRIEYAPAEPVLEEITLPAHLKRSD